MNHANRMSGMTMAVLELLKFGLAMAGLFLLMVHGSRAYEAYNSQYWPTTTVEILRSAVDATGDFQGNRQYYSRIKYGYAIVPHQNERAENEQAENDDAYFINTRIGINPIPPVNSRAIAEAKLDLYPKGSSVEVYYNPNRPERSMLEPDFLLRGQISPLRS